MYSISIQVLEYFRHLNILSISETYFYTLQESLLHKIVWLTWCFEQVCMLQSCIKFWILSSQKTAIEEVKEKQKSGMKNAVAGDAKYDSPGTTNNIFGFHIKF